MVADRVRKDGGGGAYRPGGPDVRRPFAGGQLRRSHPAVVKSLVHSVLLYVLSSLPSDPVSLTFTFAVLVQKSKCL